MPASEQFDALVCRLLKIDADEAPPEFLADEYLLSGLDGADYGSNYVGARDTCSFGVYVTSPDPTGNSAGDNRHWAVARGYLARTRCEEAKNACRSNAGRNDRRYVYQRLSR